MFHFGLYSIMIAPYCWGKTSSFTKHVGPTVDEIQNSGVNLQRRHCSISGSVRQSAGKRSFDRNGGSTEGG